MWKQRGQFPKNNLLALKGQLRAEQENSWPGTEGRDQNPESAKGVSGMVTSSLALGWGFEGHTWTPREPAFLLWIPLNEVDPTLLVCPVAQQIQTTLGG